MASADCYACHSAEGFAAKLQGNKVDTAQKETFHTVSCLACHNPRSTVATVTEIYDYLRLVFARLGEPRCYQCGEPIRQQAPEQILEALLELSAGTRTMILAPMPVPRRFPGSDRASRSARNSGKPHAARMRVTV